VAVAVQAVDDFDFSKNSPLSSVPHRRLFAGPPQDLINKFNKSFCSLHGYVFGTPRSLSEKISTHSTRPGIKVVAVDVAVVVSVERTLDEAEVVAVVPAEVDSDVVAVDSTVVVAVDDIVDVIEDVAEETAVDEGDVV
jgi:hypothetical protein